MKKLLTIGLILFIIIGSAEAQRPGTAIRRHAIREGVRNGELTRFEVRDLRRDQVRYHRMERQARRDGTVTPRERRKLYRMKVENRRELIRYKHNPRRRLI